MQHLSELAAFGHLEREIADRDQSAEPLGHMLHVKRDDRRRAGLHRTHLRHRGAHGIVRSPTGPGSRRADHDGPANRRVTAGTIPCGRKNTISTMAAP